MNPAQFRTLLGRVGASQTAFAGLMRVSARQVRRWASGDSEIPRSVEIVLRLLASGKVSLDDI